MEHYIVSARKYRPSTFASVVGQPALTATLKNAIASDRLAHAYLFCGSRGVGKTSCARIFAKTINCENPGPDGEACNNCSSCAAFNEGRSLNVVELDAASHNSIEDIRSMIEQVQLPPTQGRYRVFIIDEVHMLSTSAFNAFLKTLEEPPSYVIFILATTEKHKIIPTILSRCQIYDFNRITVRDMVDHLSYVARNEGITADPAALAVIAGKADGAMRDALSIFDQVAASSRGNITYQSTIDNLNVLDHAYYKRLIDAFLSNNVPEALLIYKQIRDKGFDSQFFVNGLALYIRDLMLASGQQTLPMLEVPDQMRAEMAATASRCRPEFLYKAMDLCNETDLNYRQASNKQFLVELMLIKLCQPLSPSHSDSGDGEGQLKPIAAFTEPHGVEPQPLRRQSAQPQPVASAPSPAPASYDIRPLEPMVAAEPRPAMTARPRLRTPELSLRKTLTRPEDAVDAAAPHADVRSASYTDAAVTDSWQSYIQSHNTARLLINIMRNCSPVRTGDDSFRVEVENDIQLNLLNDNLSDITSYLRDAVINDNITLDAVIKNGPSSPKTWTEREVLDHMKRTNPDFGAFVDDFNLTLL
jgi:DNA polymerase-3 subunit gamma/tau